MPAGAGHPIEALNVWISKVRQGVTTEAVRGGVAATDGGPGTPSSAAKEHGGKEDGQGQHLLCANGDGECFSLFFTHFFIMSWANASINSNKSNGLQNIKVPYDRPAN